MRCRDTPLRQTCVVTLDSGRNLIVKVVLSPWLAGEYGKLNACGDVVRGACVVFRLGLVCLAQSIVQ